MHTTMVGRFIVIHNGDWSGVAYLDLGNGKPHVEVDGELFLALCKRICAQEITKVVENAVEDWLGGTNEQKEAG
jgi:hypothetical protein